MYGKFVGFVYYVNIVIQAVISLVFPVFLLVAFSWFLVERQGAPEWIYVIFILFGVFVGLISMVKYILSATAAASALEKQREESDFAEANKRNRSGKEGNGDSK